MFAALNNLSDPESDNESVEDGNRDLYSCTPAEIICQPVDISDIREIHPRGLLNQRNNCYLNCVIQSLFAFDDFRVLLHKLSFLVEYLDAESTPICLALHILYQQWLDGESLDLQPWKRQSIYPESFEEVLVRFCQNDAGTHEDAHEFFHYLIDSMHEEFSRLKNFESNATVSKPSSNGFIAVPSRRKNRVVINLDETPITRLFSGRIRCFISKKSSQQCVPFFSLQLALDPSQPQSIESLLSEFSAPAKLTARKEGKQINTSQTSLIDAYPEILTLHLKRFAFNGSTIQKVHQHVSFPEKFCLPESCLTKALKSLGYMYRLRSVICHSGQTPIRGHYIAYFRNAKHGWLCADDSSIVKVKWPEVQRQQAYILLYELNKRHL